MPDHGRCWISSVWPVLNVEVKNWDLSNSHLCYLKLESTKIAENLTKTNTAYFPVQIKFKNKVAFPIQNRWNKMLYSHRFIMSSLQSQMSGAMKLDATLQLLDHFSSNIYISLWTCSTFCPLCEIPQNKQLMLQRSTHICRNSSVHIVATYNMLLNVAELLHP